MASIAMHKIQTILQNLYAFLFPGSADIRALEQMSTAQLLSALKPNNKPEIHPAIQALFAYRDPLVRRAIREIKYRGNPKLIALFGSILYDFILEEYGDTGALPHKERLLLIPIPNSRKRRRKRGFNQTELLAQALIQHDTQKNLVLLTKALVKIRDTKSQTELPDRKSRERNVYRAFSVPKPKKIIGRTILLLDDTATTGSTLLEARRVLLEAGARNVFCLALAH